MRRCGRFLLGSTSRSTCQASKGWPNARAQGADSAEESVSWALFVEVTTLGQIGKWHRVTWLTAEPTHTVGDILDGRASIWLTDRDFEVLESLLRRSCLAARHLLPGREGLFADRTALSRGMGRLYREGLVSKGRVASWNKDEVIGWEPVFALTRHGLRFLLAAGSRAAESVSTRWRSLSEGEQKRNNASHEVAVADLCWALQDVVSGPKREVDWVGSAALIGRVGPNALHALARRSMVSPDAAVSVFQPEGMDVVLVEFEQSARASAIESRLGAYVSYFEQRVWQRQFPLALEPRVVLSLSTRSDRLRRYTNPFAVSLEVARQMSHRLWSIRDRVFFVEEESWRRGALVGRRIHEADEVDLSEALVTRVEPILKGLGR